MWAAIRRWAAPACCMSMAFPTRRSSDLGIIAAGYVGSFLLAGAYLAVSCMTSAMTRNQVVAFILRSEEHTSELQSRRDLVCRLLLEKKNTSVMAWLMVAWEPELETVLST